MTKPDKADDAIPAGLLDSAKQRTKLFVEKLQKAMKDIELQIEQNEGIYPFNGGRLTQAELCRRAGVSNIALQGPAHKLTTKLVVDSWLQRIKAGTVTGKKSVRKTVTGRAEAWKAQHGAIAQAYHKSQLERIDLLARIKTLENENEALRTQLASSGAAKVTALPKKRS